jgi:hypothetical protein
MHARTRCETNNLIGGSRSIATARLRWDSVSISSVRGVRDQPGRTLRGVTPEALSPALNPRRLTDTSSTRRAAQAHYTENERASVSPSRVILLRTGRMG